MPQRSRSDGAPVAITGMGAVCALGEGCDALWSAIEAGRDGLRPVRRFGSADFPTYFAGTVPAWEGPLPPGMEPFDLSLKLGAAAVREALASAGVELGKVGPSRVALVNGTSLGGDEDGVHTVAERIARELGLRGPVLTVSTACCASTNAIGLGRDLLDLGAADVVVAGGVDVLTQAMLAGFHALGVLSAGKCAPFSEPSGTTLGEGAGFVVLEREGDARSRGADPGAFLLGYGLSADAYHETAPDPGGAGVARAISAALRDAAVAPEDIGYVNAHGTGTAANDAAEWRGLQRVFQARAASLPVSATKSFFGHAQGATGALELIATLLAMRRGVVPQTLHFKGPRAGAPADPVGQDRPRPHEYRFAVCTNSAFGGANAALVIGRRPVRKKPPARRPVFVRGAGALGPFGLDLDALCSAVAERRVARGRVPPFQIERLVRTVDPRGLDASARLVIAAAAQALKDADLSICGELRERAGLVTAATRLPAGSGEEFDRSTELRGAARASGSAFARMVLNAPAGSCAKAFSLRGPTSTVAMGPGSGALAVAYAAHLLSARGDADVLLAAGVDELDRHGAGSGDSEGAACLVLSSDPGKGRAVRLSGWGVAGPGQLLVAIREALASSQPSRVGALYGSGPGDEVRALGMAAPWTDVAAASGRGEALDSAAACALAYRGVSRGLHEAALVIASASCGCCALLLERGGADET